MSLVPRSSFFDVERYFDSPFFGMRASEGTRDTAFSPRVDVREKEDGYEITAELPGVSKDDVNITLNNGILSIQAESRQEDTQEENGRVIRQERRYGKFVRSFDLGNQVQDSDIKANFENGVLKLNVPKTDPQSAAKRIEIQ
jgi:HSP20 family protein